MFGDILVHTRPVTSVDFQIPLAVLTSPPTTEGELLLYALCLSELSPLRASSSSSLLPIQGLRVCSCVFFPLVPLSLIEF